MRFAIKKLSIITILFIIAIVFVACNDSIALEIADFSYRHYNINNSELETVSTYNIIDTEDTISTYEYLIETAKYNLINTPYASKIAIAEGSVTAGSMGYVNMVASSLFIKNDNSWYNQHVVKFYESKPLILLSIMQNSLNQAERCYSVDGFSLVKQQANKSASYQDEFPYAVSDWSDGKIKQSDIGESIDYNYDFINISPYNIEIDTIKTDSITIISNNNYYSIDFELDLSNEQARDKATSKQRDFMRKTSNMDNLDYNKIIINIKIWKNGLPKSMEIYEEWSGSYSVFMVNVWITSSTTTNTYYSYHRDDSDYSNHDIDLSWAIGQ